MTAANADLAAENAKLRAELEAERHRANEAERREAAKDSALTEALEHQQATAEVLTVISRSPADLQAVLDAIVERTARLLNSPGSSVWLLDGDHIQPVSVVEDGQLQPDNRLASPSISANALDPASVSGTILREKRTLTLSGGADAVIARYPSLASIREYARARGTELWGSAIAVPLLRDGAVFGMINVSRPSPASYTDRQIALLETFAEQAVIAMENTRLFEALAERNYELAEALEQQTATAEVLSLISRMPVDLDPVLSAVTERAARLCGAAHARIWQVDGDRIRALAGWWDDGDPGSDYGIQPGDVHVLGLGPVGQAIRAGRVVYQPDERRADATGSWEDGLRARLGVPLLREGIAIGGMFIGHRDPNAFTPQQIALIQTFADQAVIAIENARLFNELREALEQQMAVAGVLQAISRSAFDLQTVLDTLTENAVRLLGTAGGTIMQRDGERLRNASWYGNSDAEQMAVPGEYALTDDTWPVTRVIRDRRPLVQIIRASDPDIARAPRSVRDYFNRVQVVSLLYVPLMKDDKAIGVIDVWAHAERDYSERNIKLMQTFADQAVIAIENARLFAELQQRTRELEEVNRQLEAASRHKSAFLSAMSHELRTPLNAVIGYSEILAEDAQDAGHTDLIPDLEKINAAAKHLLSLISNVLNLSKIEAGRMDLAIEDFTVEKLLGEVEAVVPPLMSKNANRFVLDVATDLGSMHTDKTKLRQCLLNLLSNAAKFTEQGTITMQAQREPFEAGDWLSFAVTDTGIGLSEEQLGRLFQTFTQAEAGTSVRYGGTGLGLALSREFCRLLGGDITVTSEPGRGSVFTIRLPADVRTAATPE